MTARAAMVWLLVLTLLLVGMTFAVNALQPRVPARPAPVRATPPASDSPVLVAAAGDCRWPPVVRPYGWST